MEKEGPKSVNPSNAEDSKSKLKPSNTLMSKQMTNGVSFVEKPSEKKPAEKEFSPKFKEIMRRVRFRLRLYMFVKKGGENSDDPDEPINPGYKILKKILQNHYRSNESAKRVLEYVKHLSFFSEFINEMGDVEDRALLELCKRLKFESYPGGTYVFKEGEETNNKYYIILRGSVSVVKKKDANVFYQQRLTRLKGLYDNKKVEESPLDLLVAEMGVKTKDIFEGEGFEDKSLVDGYTKRSVSILTNTFCEFIIVQKEDYLQIANRFDLKRQAKMAFMMKHIPFLDSLNSMAIVEDLYYLIKDEEYPKDTVIVNENQPGEYVYFIAAGECVVLKNFSINRTKTGADYGFVEMKKAIATIDTGSCFGEELLVDENQPYAYTVKIKSSSASLYCIKKTDFLMRFPPECLRIVIESFYIKDKVHEERIHEIEKDIAMGTIDKSESPDKIKGTEFFRLLKPQYRMKMAQHIHLTQRKHFTLTSRNSESKESHAYSNNARENSSGRSVEEGEPIPVIQRAQIDLTKVKYTRTRTPGRIVVASISKNQTQGEKDTLHYAQNSLSKIRQSNSRTEILNSDTENKTSREKTTSRDKFTSTGRSIVARGTHLKHSMSPSNKDERGTSESEKKYVNDYFFGSNLQLEKFDFGPARYLPEKPPKLPKILPSQSQISFGNQPYFKPASPTSAYKSPGLLDSRQEKLEFTNLVERVRGDRAPQAVFAKLANLIEKKKSNKKRSGKSKDKNFMLIKTIVPSLLAKANGDLGDMSPINRLQRSKDERVSFGIDDQSPKGSLTAFDGEISGRNVDKRVPSKENFKTVPENKIITLVKGKSMQKLKDKSALKSQVYQFE